MKRVDEGHKMMTPKSYKFGCPSQHDLNDLPPALVEIHQKQRAMWNRLVELNEEDRQSYRALVAQAGGDEIALLVEEKDKVELQVDSLLSVPKKTRDTAALKDATAHLKAVKADLKAARASAAGKIKPQLEAAQAQFYERVKAITRESELWWAHSEVVLERFDVARSKAMKENADLWKKGPYNFPLHLRVRWHNGLPFATLTSTGSTVAKIAGTGRHRVLSIAVASEGRSKEFVEVPFVLHREPLAGAIVRSVTLKRERVGAMYRWSVHITVQEPFEFQPNNRSATYILQPTDRPGAIHTDAALSDQYVLRTVHLEELQSKLDKKAGEFFKRGNFAWQVDPDTWQAERLAQLRDRDRVGYYALKSLKDHVEAVGHFVLACSRMEAELRQLEDKTMADRDNQFYVEAKRLTTAYGRIDVVKPRLFLGGHNNKLRPAYGEFVEKLKHSAKKHGCELVFYSSADDIPQMKTAA
jgi:hypothetical protein